MAPLIYTLNDATFSPKMAAFDYDWTIVNPKDGKTFPLSLDDWQWFAPNVPQIIKEYHEKDYMIVIFTNQTKQWKCEQIKQVCSILEIPLFICICMDKSEHKPNTLMFDELVKDNLINKTESFFVGDALGRPSDFSDSDKIFAENIGIKCISPESLFMKTTFVVEKIPRSETPEIIIMMGYPGSGKTTIAQEICNDPNYILIKGDDYKSNTPKMIKASQEHIREKKSIVFDATNSSTKKRLLFINIAQMYYYKIRCIHVSTSLDISYKRNKCRSDKKQVPKIAYSVYKKHFDEPLESEGFDLITLN